MKERGVRSLRASHIVFGIRKIYNKIKELIVKQEKQETQYNSLIAV